MASPPRPYERPPYSPPPIPADGIKARSQRGPIGERWWSRRFIAVLESFGMGARLDRGRRYARLGQVVSMDVVPGRVTATVQGSRPRPYKVSIALAPLSDTDWARVAEAMASRSAFLAHLLSGEMPDEIEEAFAESSVSLFPARQSDLRTDCSCPDDANPCKHIAAVLFLLAEAFDDDPFLILAWRGLGRDPLLERLRALRTAGAKVAARGARPSSRPAFDLGWPVEPGATRSSKSSSTASSSAAVSVSSSAVSAPAPRDFWRQGTIEAPVAVPASTPVPDALLRLLDPLPITAGERGVADLLRGAYEVLGEEPVTD
jgi:uncharacterized Zn finger protein